MNNIKLVNKDGEMLVSSREIAENFDKKHAEILYAIEGRVSKGVVKNHGLINKGIKHFDRMFIKIPYVDVMGRTQHEYLINRDGFSLLVMGFTGERALEWKIKYIEAFNEMESIFRNKNNSLKTCENTDEIFLDKAKHVYVLLANDNSVKIGVSNNVEHRKHVIENYIGKEIVKYHYTPLCSNPFKIENMAHKYFNKNNIYGEWFDIDYEEACRYVESLFDLCASFSYKSKKYENEKIDKIFEKVRLTTNNTLSLDEIKEKLRYYVDNGMLSHIPETYEDAMKMICEQNILYYTKLKDCLSY